MRTVNYVLAALPPSPHTPELLAPPYRPPADLNYRRVGLAVGSMRRHITDEGWQLFQGLECAGYELTGRCMGWGVDVPYILTAARPDVIMLQDKREWIGRTAGPGFDERERFVNVEALRDRHDVFKLTVLKDAQHDLAFHRESAEEIGCHAWVTYYHPRIVKHLAPFVRERHLVRTFHSVDSNIVPPFRSSRIGVACLSGAVSGAYPLRTRLFEAARAGKLDTTAILQHPGYGRRQCFTPDYMEWLSYHKVAVCTSSVYGYALRKIIEATACGCSVLTDLPADDCLPLIDANLVRIDPDMPTPAVADLLDRMAMVWEPDRQLELSLLANSWYDYRAAGSRLADDIEDLRREYVQ